MANRATSLHVAMTAVGGALGSLAPNPALGFLIGSATPVGAHFLHHYTMVRRPRPPTLARIGGALHWLDFFDRILFEKTRYDFKLSPLGHRDRVRQACADIALRGRHVGVTAGFDEQAAKATEQHPQAASGIVLHDARSVERLASRARPLRILCMAMHPALAATFLDMRDRLGIPIELDTGAVNGVIAVEWAATALRGSEPYDLVSLPSSLFFLAQQKISTTDIDRAYSLTFPVYAQRQHVIRSLRERDDHRYAVDYYRYLDGSSAVEMIETFKSNGQQRFKERPYETGNRFDLMELEPNEAFVVWAPLNRIALSFRGLSSTYEYRYWVCLYMLQQAFPNRQLRRAFVHTFLASWTHCRANPHYAASLVHGDPRARADLRRALRCQIGGV